MSFLRIRFRKKRRHSITAQEILDRLDRYIHDGQSKPIKLLVTHWRDQQEAISYRELRNAIKDEGMTGDLFREWTNDYSRFVIDKMTPIWRDAMQAGSHGQPIMDKKQELFRFDLNNPHSLKWIDERGASFVTNATAQQRQAMQSLIRQYGYEKYGADELAKIIRPCIGLTDAQSRAALRYYDALKANLREQHPRMKESNLKDRCMEKTMIFAERMHRDRARTIAQTEMAFAYNHGMHESMAQAMQQGLMGVMEKRWVTSSNDNVCATCDALNGTQIGFDVPFDFGKHRHLFDGQEDVPPAHPRCACCVQYIEIAPPVFEPDMVLQEPLSDSNAGSTIGTENLPGDDEIKNTISRMVDQSPEHVRNAFRMCQNEFKPYEEIPANETMHYDRQSGVVRLNLERAVNGEYGHEPYQLVFHEYAHNIDDLLGKRYGGRTYLSVSYKNGEFVKAADRDVENMLMRTFRNGIDKYMPDVTARDVLYAVQNQAESESLVEEARLMRRAVRNGEMTVVEMLDNDDIAMSLWKEYAMFDRVTVSKDLCDVLKTLPENSTSGLSDILEYRIGLDAPIGYGHGRSYWEYSPGDPNNAALATEAFAQMFSSEVANSKSLKVIKELLPESYSVFKEMLEVVK